MPTPRQARHGSALLLAIVSLTISPTVAAPPAQADASVTAGEGDEDRGLARPRPVARDRRDAPDPPPKAANAAARRMRQAAAIPVAATPPPEATSVPADSADRRSLNEYLIRDRSVTILLTAAQRAIAEHRHDDALVELQALFDAPVDVFIWHGESGAPQSARAGAAELFRNLPTAAIDEYERRYGPDAQRLLAEFQDTHDPESQRELLRRFEFTTAGADALRGAANTALDCGEFVEAARLFERWLTHPLAGHSADSSERLRADAAALLAGETGFRNAHLELDSSQLLRHAGRTQSVQAWRTEISTAIGRHTPNSATDGSNWRLALGNAQAHRQAAGTVPTLDPLWTAPHAELVADDGVQTAGYSTEASSAELLSHWMESRVERRLPFAGATFAIVDGGQLLVRDFQGVTARALRSGDVVWQFPCESGLARRAAQATARATSTPDAPIAAALLFNEFFAQNSVLGMLASDGRRLYCIDLCPASDPAITDESAAHSNRLLALALDVEDREAGSLLWEAGGDGWFFLGPPLPADDGLFAIVERDSLVSLISLDAKTGAVRWEQPISLVDAAIGNDPQRARQACMPTLAGGILVCPTHLGTIVGVDARTGVLEWVYAYAETSGPSQPWRKTRAYDREFGSPEHPNLPVIVGGTVVVLAPQSMFVHGIDLHSGRFLWKEERGDAYYIASAGDDLVLLVGPRECAARRIESGQQIWSRRIDTPSGRGLALDDAFLLPTADGRIMSLDIQTGQVAPDLLPRTQRTRNVVMRVGQGIGLESDTPWPDPAALAGNLLCSGEFIVSCTPAGVAVYPQAGVVLDAIVAESRTRPLSTADWLERGELELRLGDVAAAEQSLWNVLDGNPSQRIRALAESRLRELLYVELATGDDPDQRLSSLARLCVQPGDQARLLAHRLDYELQSDRPTAALQATASLMESGIGQPVAMDARGEYAVLPQRRAAAALVRYARHCPTETRVALLRQAEVAPVDCLVDVAEFGTLTTETRAARAREVANLIDRREYQAAELLLLAEVRLPESTVNCSASERLAALWRTCGLHRDATRLLAGSGLGADAEAPLEPIARAEIEQQLEFDDGVSGNAKSDPGTLDELLSRNREYSRQPAGSRVLFDRGLQSGPDRTSAFSVVDLTEPTLVADLEPLPARVWKSGDAGRYDAGHFVPIAGQGDIHGISLLEGRMIWSASAASHRTGDKPQLGPYGPEYCILQSHETVTALHPQDGRVLWRRSDIPYDAGLVRDESIGMIADDRALVIFDADLTAYRVLDPRSGELLQTGVLETCTEPRRRGWAFGRRLLYVTQGSEPRLRLWDPFSDDPLLDEPCRGRCLIDSGLGSGLAVILNGRRLSILDTASAACLWQTDLTESAAAATRQIRAVGECDRFCIHLEQDVADSPSSQATHDISGVPSLPVGGVLYVVDRRSRTDWSRAVPRCNLLLFPNDRLPMLVTLGRTREAHAEQGAGFVLEVMDGATGRTLACRSDLARTSKLLLHTRYDVQQRSLELLGKDSLITVRLVAQ